MYYVKQLNDSDCGFACLKMMMAKTLKNKSFLTIQQDLNHGPYNYLDLIKIANKYGVIVNGYIYEDSDFYGSDIKNIIVSIKNEDGFKHAVIIRKATKKRVYIKDPYLGNYSLSNKKFMSIWDKTILKIDRVYDVKKIKKSTFPSFKKWTFLSILFRLLSFLLTVCFIGFMDYSISFIWGLVLFALAMVFELFYRLNIIREMKEIDKKILLKTDLKNFNYQGQEFLNVFSKFKENETTLFPSLVYAISMTITLVVIFVLNDWICAISILGILLICLADYLFNNSALKMRKHAIELEEKNLIRSRVDDHFLTNLSKISQTSYQYGGIFMAKKILISFLIVIIVSSQMFALEIMSLSYIVFYTIGYGYLFSNISFILNFKEKKDELDSYRLYLMNSTKEKN